MAMLGTTSDPATGLKGPPAPGLIGREPCKGIGAGGRIRTGTPLLTTDFKSVASTIPPRPRPESVYTGETSPATLPVSSISF